MKTIVKLLLSLLLCISMATVYAATSKAITVKGWANEAFMAAYSYGFVKYNDDLIQASQYFTPEAWKNFKSALDKSGMIEMIKKERLISNGLAEGTGPLILQQGTLNGVHTWVVQFPAVITYQGADAIHKVQHVMVNMTIISTNGKKGVRGMAIQKMDVNLLSENVPSQVSPEFSTEYGKALETAKPQGSGGPAVNIMGAPQSDGENQ